MPSAILRSRYDNTDYHKQGEGLRQMTAPRIIVDLVERFDRNRDAYRAGHYNETQLRREFIDPFFKALGWDIDNEQGNAENYKDVIHEDAIKIGSATKAPDYCFRIGGMRKFFLEAKKPSIDIKGDPGPAYQLRRYAWSGKLPLSILTDFEEFAVYDCRIRPVLTDKSSAARILYLKYTDYAEKWDEIVSIFSKDAVLKGSFDKYAEKSRLKKGTAQVDDAFLAEIESWRDELAHNIALRNPKLSSRQLNFAVQMTVDRIIFLRICEDRGIERYGELMALLNGDSTYQRLLALFRNADDRYNSGLFHFTKEKDRPEDPDELTPNLVIDDKVLKDIFRGLYYPESPYAFSVLPTEILGQVYEQFLGRVITLTAGHHAKVEEKPEVKKAGGVFYTPSYIVDYIVQNTVGKLVEDKTPKEVEKIKILDPACGSGSFLLGAYQFLLNWHLDWYLANDPAKWAKSKNSPIVETIRSSVNNQSSIINNHSYKLTLNERKRILLNNIFGVDIDSQAVEVTKLSLLLKVLEGEKQLIYFHRALPDLALNIKCGNSLIASDFYNNQQMTMFDDEECYKINVFDWKAGFPEIFSRKNPGFDAVIGNPPWGATFSIHELEYIKSSFRTASGKNVDSYALFIEQALKKVKMGGMASYIAPDTFLRKDDHEKLREFILTNTTVEELIETGPVFIQVPDTWCLVFLLLNTKPTSRNKIIHKKISRFVVNAGERLRKFGGSSWDIENKIKQSIWLKSQHLVIGYRSSESEQQIIRKIENQSNLFNLNNRFRISRGEEGSKFSLSSTNDGDFRIVIPADISRYYTSEGIKIKSDTLTSNKLVDFYAHPKIWIIRIQKLRWEQRLVTSFDIRNNSASMKTLQVIVSVDDNLCDLMFLQGILSSSLINFWCTNYLADDMNKSYLEKIPVPEFNPKLSKCVETMLDLHKKLAAAKTPNEKTVLQRQITATDGQIDRLVYELYGLTADEIKLIEGSVK